MVVMKTPTVVVKCLATSKEELGATLDLETASRVEVGWACDVIDYLRRGSVVLTAVVALLDRGVHTPSLMLMMVAIAL